ncbi:MAG: hypothetical protein LH618_03855 [Saprospiraceae bacterium]|nr:hypothetical protein [Saprospiraceae bacterium]
MLRPFYYLFALVALCLPSACRQEPPGPPPPSAKAQKMLDEDRDTLTGEPIRHENAWMDRGCEVISDAEVLHLFGIDVNRDVFNARSLPKQSFCLRTWKKPDWKQRESNNEQEGATYLDPANILTVQVFSYGTTLVAKEQFAQLRKDRRSTYEEDVTGLGDDALWSTNTSTLLVRKQYQVLNIALTIADQPHDNLALAKALALLALARM